MRSSGWSFLLRGVVAVMVVSCGLGVVAHTQTFTTLASFDIAANGISVSPVGSMIQSTNGNLYGATYSGGIGLGSIFEVTAGGELTNLYSFCESFPPCNGDFPLWGLTLAPDGSFYGTASLEGTGSPARGTIFRMRFDGAPTILYSFCPTTACSGGSYPAGMILGENGKFYGVTSFGGGYNFGTFFEITPNGQFRDLYTFSDGATVHPPVQGRHGQFYGTTGTGGSIGAGAIYEITPSGSYQVLYSFCQGATCGDGGAPSNLVQDAEGTLYGTTMLGGAHSYGTVFAFTPKNKYVVLHAFDFTDGGCPCSGLTLANDGNLYGTTVYGSGGSGNIFEITRSGEFKSLYSFCNAASCPLIVPSALFQGTDGLLYGATAYGGTYGVGTVFSLNNNLSPLVETVPIAGKVGTRVIILGNNLTGSTSVTFNGVAAAFTVESGTYIKATVPAGATTGTVSVVTPAGTLNSNPQFVVTN